MRRKPAQVKPQRKRLPLEPLQIAIRFLFHLPMQNFHAVETHLCRGFKTCFDFDSLWTKLPERIRGNSKSIACRLSSFCLRRTLRRHGLDTRTTQADRCRGRAKLPA